MLQHMYKELHRTDLKYHKLAGCTDRQIILKATSPKTKRVEEVMRVKELADRHSLFTKWDGTDIMILNV